MIYEPLDFSDNKDFMEKIQKEHEMYANSVQYVDLPPIPEFIPIEEQFKDLATMDDIKLGGLIKEYWTQIVEEAYNKTENAINRIFIFTNVKFINGLRKYLSSVNLNSINLSHIMMINNMVYNCITSSTRNEDVVKAFMQLTKTINRNHISAINSEVSIDEDTANRLVIAAYSSSDMATKASAINSIIMKTSMSVDDIIGVYHVLYQHISEIFIGTMFNVKSEFENNHEQEMYERCTTAILDYLNMQEQGVIFGTLDYYVQSASFLYKGWTKRINLRTIPVDKYNRILWGIKEIEMSKNYYVD